MLLLLFLSVYLFIYERGRERGGGQRERGRQGIPSRLRAVGAGPDAGLELMNHEITALAEIKSRTLNRLSHPGVPDIWFLLSEEVYLTPILLFKNYYLTGHEVTSEKCHFFFLKLLKLLNCSTFLEHSLCPRRALEELQSSVIQKAGKRISTFG